MVGDIPLSARFSSEHTKLWPRRADTRNVRIGARVSGLNSPVIGPDSSKDFAPVAQKYLSVLPRAVPVRRLVGPPDVRGPAWTSLRYGFEGLSVFATLLPTYAFAADPETLSRALTELRRSGLSMEEIADARRALWKAYVTGALPSVPPTLESLNNSESYTRLSAELRAMVSEKFAELSPESRGRIAQLVQSDAYFGLDAASQKAVLRAWLVHHEAIEASDLIATMAISPGFSTLGVDERMRLLRYVQGTDSILSRHVRLELEKRMLEGSFKSAAAPEQGAALKKFLSEEEGTPSGVPTWNADFDSKRRNYVLSEPVPMPQYAFRSGKADGQKWVVDVGVKKIPIVIAVGGPPPGQFLQTADQIAKAIAALPAQSLAELSIVEVNTLPSPDDTYFATTWNEPDFRAYMTAGENGLVNVFPTKTEQAQHSVDGTFIHEAAHLWSRKVWGPDGSPGWTDWEARMKSDGFHASLYGRHNAAEDVAETVTLYHIVKGTPQEASIRALFPARFAYLDQVIVVAEASLGGLTLAAA